MKNLNRVNFSYYEDTDQIINLAQRPRRAKNKRGATKSNFTKNKIDKSVTLQRKARRKLKYSFVV